MLLLTGKLLKAMGWIYFNRGTRTGQGPSRMGCDEKPQAILSQTQALMILYFAFDRVLSLRRGTIPEFHGPALPCQLASRHQLLASPQLRAPSLLLLRSC